MPSPPPRSRCSRSARLRSHWANSPATAARGPSSRQPWSAEAINQLYWFVFAICAVVFVAVETALVLFAIRPPPALDCRGCWRGRRSTETRARDHLDPIPAVILVGIAAVVLARSLAVEATSGERANELVVEVQGHQFYWQHVYPEGQIAIDRLVLPVDRPVKLELVSFDVNHSWWVPELTGSVTQYPAERTCSASRRRRRASTRAAAPSFVASFTP